MNEPIEILGVTDFEERFVKSTDKLVIFYAEDVLLESGSRHQVDMVNLFMKFFGELGYRFIFIKDAYDILDDKNLDLIHVWMKAMPPYTDKHEKLIYSLPSYLYGFWYLSRIGVRNLSHIVKKKFTPELINQEPAELFFSSLQERFVEENEIKPGMSGGNVSEIPENCILIPAQGNWTPANYKRYVDFLDVVNAVLKTRGLAPVWIMPQPEMGEDIASELTKLHDPAKGIYFEDCNLHEVLTKTKLVVTRCSTVALEAMLYKKPAIVTAQVDFHHGVNVLRKSDEMALAIKAVQEREFSYEKYLFWFFKHQHVEPAKPAQTLHKIQKLFDTIV